MTRSIRGSLVMGTVVATVVIIAVAGTAVYRGVRSALVRQVDQGLTNEARLLASAVRAAPEGIELEFEELDVERFARDGGAAYLQVWLEDGAVLYRSPSLHGGDLSGVRADVDEKLLLWTSVAGNSLVRAVVLAFRPLPDKDDGEAATPSLELATPEMRLALGRSVADIDALLARLRGLLALVGFVTATATGGVLALVIRRSLRPLDLLAGEISSLSDGSLSSRIHIAATPNEIAPVVNQLNELLARLEAAFQRERTFSADVAHELRTPLAGLRATIEVTLSRSRPAGDYRATLTELLGIVGRLQAMVERLLYLGRLESGQIEIEEGMVALGELARKSWKPLEGRAAQRRLDVRWNLNPGVGVVTDALLLEIAIRNLLENAVAYAKNGGYVVITVEERADHSVLRVINDGSKVAQEDVPALMDRFSRADLSRAATGIHYGLGLAIVTRIAAVLRGALVVRSCVGGDFEVVLSMENGSLQSEG